MQDNFTRTCGFSSDFFSASLTLNQALCCVLRRFMWQEHKVLKVSRYFLSVRRHWSHYATSVWGKEGVTWTWKGIKSESCGLLWGRALGGSFKQGNGRNLGKGGCVYEWLTKQPGFYRLQYSCLPLSNPVSGHWGAQLHSSDYRELFFAFLKISKLQ